MVDQITNMYIWDMDETLILLKCLITGTYAEFFNGAKNVKKGIEIGKLWEDQILQICDNHFLYEQIENFNQPYLEVMNEFDDKIDLSNYDFNKDGFIQSLDDVNKRKLAYRHRFIAQQYQKGLHGLLDEETMKFWDNLYNVTDNYTEKWFSSARACLEQCVVGPTSTNSQNVNILVTSGSLIPSLVKCLLFKLDNLFTYENVYSSWEVGKLKCFSWIKERFSGPHVQFCVIGDGWEECEGAETMKWPFVKIDPKPSSYHRFPGLTVRDLGHYLSVVYGDSHKEDEENIVI